MRGGCPFYISYLLLGPLLLATGINTIITSAGQSGLGIVIVSVSAPWTLIGALHIIKQNCIVIPIPPPISTPTVIIHQQEEIQYIHVVRPPGTECIICEENPRVIAYIPCGHTVCMSCNEKLIDKPCSFCRAPIFDRLRLY